MRMRGWIWLLVVLLLGGYAGVRLQEGRGLETDLLAMLPKTERNPAAERGVRALAQAMGDRAVLVVGAPDPQRAKAAARQLVSRLEASQAFANVQGELPAVDPGLVPRFYAPFRRRLPAPGLPEAEGAEALAARIQTRLTSPTGLGFGLNPAEDPAGRLQAFLAQLPLATSRLELQDNLLVMPSPEGLHVLVTAGLKGSAFDPDVQERTLATVSEATAELRRSCPEATLLRTGAVFYGAEARRTAEREMRLLSGLSMGLIVLLYLAVFRTLRHLGLGMICVAAGLIAATAVSLLVFGKLFLLTLVCGMSVLGDAVDYSFLYFAHHLEIGKTWEPWKALRDLRKPLFQGMATTLLGYVALLLAPFPGLRQIAVFSMVGLLGAFLTVILVLPAWLKLPARPQPRLMGSLGRLLHRAQDAAHARRLMPLLVLGTVLLGVLALRGRTDDAVQGLIRPSLTLQAEEAKIRSLMGISNQGLFYLVEGRDADEVLAREEALRSRLLPLLEAQELDGVQALSSFVPSAATQVRTLEARQRELPALEAALRVVGFRPDVIAQQKDDLAASRPLTLKAFLEAPFATPYRMHWLGKTDRGVASLVLPLGPATPERLRTAATDVPGVALVDKAGSVSRLMAEDRRLASWALLGAIAFVGALLAIWYGLRHAFWLLAPALAGILAALAGAATFGIPLSLFAVLALFLILGFGVDYAVFLRGSRLTDAAGTLGVLMAGASTFISYGLLAFSSTPALAGFGLVLGIGVPAAVLTSFLALRGTRR